MFRPRLLLHVLLVLTVAVMFVKMPAAEAGLWRHWWSWFPFLNMTNSETISTSTPSTFTSVLTPPIKSSAESNIQGKSQVKSDTLQRDTLQSTRPIEASSQSSVSTATSASNAASNVASNTASNVASNTASNVASNTATNAASNAATNSATNAVSNAATHAATHAPSNAVQASEVKAVTTSKAVTSSTDQATSVPAPSSPEKKDFAAILIDQAQTYLGVPYRFGATYDQDGSYHFDCSAYTQRVYRDLGIQLPRTTAKQAKVGIPVKKEDLQVGDLVFFTTRQDRSMNHDGIYIGDGKFIHASPAGGKGVQISDLTKGYWKNAYLYARRLPEATIAHK